MEVGLVRPVDIDLEMQQAYLDYAMSTIMARALPDARDGLKPVHRRILYAMYDMGLRPESAFKKSARIVGEVLGKYHPHGDMAVYEAMARMAQDFSMRCLLVEGQGNFGSVDGDPPAAMRYTEARLANPAIDLLGDIRKNTVNFSDNFDGSLTEPDVLPAALPNLLVNGATGIAVGMSTNIPPHNLGEVIDALNYMLTNWGKLDDISVEDLMQYIQGPDFPTGGVIVQRAEEDELKTAYGTGRGKITVQALAHFEELSRGRNRIIVTELPYMTNKASLIERIAELSREGKLEGLADLRDESDRQGLRIVIELTRTADPETVLQDLYKNTPMRSTFGIIMLALVDGEPRMLSLKQALRVYLDHRLEVVRRRGEYDLERARQRAHILEGLRVALKNLDEIINLIRKSPDADTARDRIMKRYKLSEIQAQAILDMPLRRLAALERKKIEEEYKEVMADIKYLEGLLKSPVKMRQVVADELREVKIDYADRRRTQIARLEAGAKTTTTVLTTTNLIAEKLIWVSASSDGMIARSLDDKPPRFSGSAAPMWSLQVSTRDTLYLVSESGEAAAIPVHALPETDNLSEGVSIHRVSPLSEKDRLAVLFTLPQKDDRPAGFYVITCTRQGMVKKTEIRELPGPAGRTFTLVRVNEGDRLSWLEITNGKRDILLATADGMAIRFPEDEVRPMGMVAAGVNGIKLQGRDEVIGMVTVPSRGDILLVASDGKAKRVAPAQFPTQGRYGQGVVAWKLPRTAELVGMTAGKGTTRITLHLEKLSSKSIRLDEAALQTRVAQGKPVIELRSDDRVTRLSVPWETPISRSAVSGKATPGRTGTSDGKQVPPVSRSRRSNVSSVQEKPQKTTKRTTQRTTKKPTIASQTSFDDIIQDAPKKTTRSRGSLAGKTSSTTTKQPASKATQPESTSKKTITRPGRVRSVPTSSASKKPAQPAEQKTPRRQARQEPAPPPVKSKTTAKKTSRSGRGSTKTS